jgi:hypothetical protein
VSTIEFRRDEQRRVFVTGQWPLYARVATLFVDNPSLGNGVSAPITKHNDDELLIIAENGHAIYRIHTIISDGAYWCEYVRGKFFPEVA